MSTDNAAPRYFTRTLKNVVVMRAVTGNRTDATHRRYPQPRLPDGRAIIVWADDEPAAKAIYRNWLAARGLREPMEAH